MKVGERSKSIVDNNYVPGQPISSTFQSNNQPINHSTLPPPMENNISTNFHVPILPRNNTRLVSQVSHLPPHHPSQNVPDHNMQMTLHHEPSHKPDKAFLFNQLTTLLKALVEL